jgi:hypothetical protein
VFPGLDLSDMLIDTYQQSVLDLDSDWYIGDSVEAKRTSVWSGCRVERKMQHSADLQHWADHIGLLRPPVCLLSCCRPLQEITQSEPPVSWDASMLFTGSRLTCMRT